MGRNLSQAIVTFKNMSKQIPQPIIRALNRTAEHVMVLAAKEVSKYYTIKQKDSKSMMKIKPKASASNLYTAVHAESRLLTPEHFKYTPTTGITSRPGTGWKNYHKRPTTTVTIKKGNKQVIRHAFVAIMRGQRNVFMRNQGTNKVVSFRSVSLPQMIANEKIMEVIDKDRQEFFEKQFKHEFEYAAEKAGWK